MRNNLKIYVGVFATVFLLMFILFYYANQHDMEQVRSNKPILESWKVCQENFLLKNKMEEKTIFFVTPTYARLEQVAELTRLMQTLIHVKEVIHWVVAEDSEECSQDVIDVLKQHPDLSYTLIAAATPPEVKSAQYVRKYGLPRGVSGRRASIKWLLTQTSSKSRGILYFGDDDNTYDLRLFHEILKIPPEKVGMWPVGLVAPWGISGPIVGMKSGQVEGFIFGGRRQRFPIDMAGFGVHLSLLHRQVPTMPFVASFEEEGFLNSLRLRSSDIIPLAANCTKIYVWHTMTFTPMFRQMSLTMQKDVQSNKETNLPALISQVSSYLTPK